MCRPLLIVVLQSSQRIQCPCYGSAKRRSIMIVLKLMDVTGHRSSLMFRYSRLESFEP